MFFNNFCNFFLTLKKSPKRKNDINKTIKICLILIFLIINKVLKAYSSAVERTAHNGLVKGSNPFKPRYHSY